MRISDWSSDVCSSDLFDVIECGQCFPCALIAAVLQRLTGTPYLVWVHGNDLLGPARFRLSRVALRAALRRARGVVANSTYTARLIADFGVPAASIRVIEPVVDLDAFRRNAPSASLRQRSEEHTSELQSILRN